MAKPSQQIDPRRERKRLRDRRAKQAARQRLQDETTALQVSIASLTAALVTKKAAAPKHCLLSWQEVAASLHAATTKSYKRMHELRRCSAEHHRLAQALYAWVASLHRAPARSPALAAWRVIQLPRHPDVRCARYLWLAEYMLKATDNQVVNALFPAPPEELVWAEWSLIGGRMLSQFVLDGSLAEVATAAWSFSQALSTILHATHGCVHNVFHVQEAKREICYNHEAFPAVQSNGLYTCFLESERVVMQTIGRLFKRKCRRNVLRAISSTQCVLRAVDVYQPYASYDSMESYARVIWPDVLSSV
ncbi:hypothetical protein SPRG_14235 [Saprolegnia parasitica CBS 223.65]|uniref:BZIP domain-containing protein n=1 Tax=Saprolegnia parasitica (strain CBS 223.65) TaxID=695850 RepID=A0A067BNB3_SAPPC|nr:hypothetical protein SPRG_14235 [Saprolegnia parasitica CBS 223.65]KDO19708.1 hypothetical protein SPRG_14235 [Saprolegnia parasitica CBS 223.65]|eukprot:XP_012209568.1 hypothetical protein SPRG_14235 [Saprolegnia parasitica CBS 223.65]